MSTISPKAIETAEAIVEKFPVLYGFAFELASIIEEHMGNPEGLLESVGGNEPALADVVPFKKKKLKLPSGFEGNYSGIAGAVIIEGGSAYLKRYTVKIISDSGLDRDFTFDSLSEAEDFIIKIAELLDSATSQPATP